MVSTRQKDGTIGNLPLETEEAIGEPEFLHETFSASDKSPTKYRKIK